MNDISAAFVRVRTNSTTPSEVQIAELFIQQYGHCFRYVAPWGQWMFYDGTRWRAEETLLVLSHIKDICLDLARGLAKPGQMLKSATISGAERIARADRRCAATIDQWDRDAWLLATPAGIVDLKTGETRPHRPEDYMTKLTGVSSDANCATPHWDAHRKKIFENDQQLIAYLDRAFGYCLTGDVSEHVLFFLHGEGRNGKSTTTNTVKHIFGNYCCVCPMEMFVYKKHGHDHPTELADLFKVRLCLASETEQGKGWSEVRIKALTGADPITARRMHKDWFRFDPTHKLMFNGNHRPGLRTVDTAIRARFNMIPFDVIIPKEDRDLGMEDKLSKEAPGILHQMIQGCLAWQRDGLQPPARVNATTDKYMDDQDQLKAWFERCVDLGAPTDMIFTTRLYASYSKWMQDAGETPLRENSFVEELEHRSAEFGIKRVPGKMTIGTRRGRGFSGIKGVSDVM